MRDKKIVVLYLMMWKASARCEELGKTKFRSAEPSSTVWLQHRLPFLNTAEGVDSKGYADAIPSLPTEPTSTTHPIQYTRVVKLYDNARAIRVWQNQDLIGQQVNGLPVILFEIRPPHELEQNYVTPMTSAPPPFRFDSACNVANNIHALHEKGALNQGKYIEGFTGQNATFKDVRVCVCSVRPDPAPKFFPIENFVGNDAHGQTRPVFDDQFKNRIFKFAEDCFEYAKAGGMLAGDFSGRKQMAPYFYFQITDGREFWSTIDGSQPFKHLSDVFATSFKFEIGKFPQRHMDIWNAIRVFNYIDMPFMVRAHKHSVRFACQLDYVTDPLYLLETQCISARELYQQFDFGTCNNECAEARFDRADPVLKQYVGPYVREAANSMYIDFTNDMYGPNGIYPNQGLVVCLFVAADCSTPKSNYVELQRVDATADKVILDVQPGDVIICRHDVKIRFVHPEVYRNQAASDKSHLCLLTMLLYIENDSALTTPPPTVTAPNEMEWLYNNLYTYYTRTNTKINIGATGELPVPPCL